MTKTAKDVLALIKDQDVKVREVVEKAGKAVGATIKVVRFARYGLGEAL